MARQHPRRMITDRMWQQLESALQEAKHSAAGAPPKLEERAFLEAILYLNLSGLSLARPASGAGLLAWGLYAFSSLGKTRRLAPALAATPERTLRASAPSSVGLDHGQSSSPCRGRAQKKRQRSGFGTLSWRVEHENPRCHPGRKLQRRAPSHCRPCP
jgi:hypothetical protein